MAQFVQFRGSVETILNDGAGNFVARGTPILRYDGALLPDPIDSGLISLWLHGNGEFEFNAPGNAAAHSGFDFRVSTVPGSMTLAVNSSTPSRIFDAVRSGLTLPCRANFLVSFQCSTGDVQFYLNDVDQAPVITPGPGAGGMFGGINGAATSAAFNPSSSDEGQYGSFWLGGTAAFVDLSIETNRRKFINADLSPVALGAQGQTPFGTAPEIYQVSGTVAADWLTNHGTAGGAFTVYAGSIEMADDPCPPDVPPDFPLVGVYKVLLPSAELQFADANGAPYAGGTLDTFVLGTTTPKTTWVDSAGDTENENPIRLDAAGRCIIYGNGGYRTVLKDSAGNLIWDQPSYTYVSVAMLPVVGAATLADAREAMGITDAIEAEAVARAAADSAEATARAAADTAEATARAAADTAEAAARVAGDAALQAEIDALPPALVSNVQGSYGQVGGDGHARITFAVAFTALSSVVVSYKGVGFGSNTLTIGNEDRFGFDIWITQAGTPIPKPNELFYYLALGT